jgi:molybdopterin-guanine dinucleotide biosynthesis protein
MPARSTLIERLVAVFVGRSFRVATVERNLRNCAAYF